MPSFTSAVVALLAWCAVGCTSAAVVPPTADIHAEGRAEALLKDTVSAAELERGGEGALERSGRSIAASTLDGRIGLRCDVVDPPRDNVLLWTTQRNANKNIVLYVGIAQTREHGLVPCKVNSGNKQCYYVFDGQEHSVSMGKNRGGCYVVGMNGYYPQLVADAKGVSLPPYGAVWTYNGVSGLTNYLAVCQTPWGHLPGYVLGDGEVCHYNYHGGTYYSTAFQWFV